MGRLFINLVYHKILLFILPFLLMAIFFGRLFYPTESLFMIPDFGESDVLHLNLPFKFFLSESLNKGEFPIWTKDLTSGFPLLAEGQIGTFYIPNLLLFRFFPFLFAYNLNLVLAYVFIYFGTYLFLRNIRLSRIFSAFGASIFTFSGFFSVHLNHLNLIQAASLAPFIFLSSNLLWQKPGFKYALVLSFFLSQQIFTGHFYMAFITLTGIAIFWLGFVLFNFEFISDSIKTQKRVLYDKTGKLFILMKRFLFLSISLSISFLLSAIQLFPTIELWQLSGRRGGLDFETVTAYPYPIKHLITFLIPYFFGDPAKATYPAFSSEWGIFWENTAYIGILPIILALLSLVFLRRRVVKIFFIVLLFSFFMVLGKYSPAYFVFSIFPFNLFRVPSKFLLLSTFALTVLSAYTLEKIVDWVTSKLTLRRHTFQILIFCCGILLIVTLMILDEFRFSYKYPPISPARLWTTKPEILKNLEKEEGRIISVGSPQIWNRIFLTNGWQEIKRYEYLKNSLFPNYNLLFSLPNISINTGGIQPRRLSIIKGLLDNIEIDENSETATISSLQKNILAINNVRYLISPFNIKGLDFIKLGEIDPPKEGNLPPFQVFQNKDLRNRSYIAFNSEKVETLEDFYDKLSEENFMAKDKILIEDNKINLSGKKDPNASVKFIKNSHNEVVLETSSQEEGVLVLTDTNYPGWSAFLDGQEVKIITANLTQKAILLPKGNHLVRFIYISSSFELGKKVTYMTWFIIVLSVFLSPFFSPHKVSHKKKLFLYL